MKNSKHTRECPKCKIQLFYSTAYRRNLQEKNQGLCYSCRALSRDAMLDETKKKISIKTKERMQSLTEEQRQKMRDDGHKYGLLQPPLTENERLAICGEGNHFYGRHHTDETKQRLKEFGITRKSSIATRTKISETLKRNKSNIGDLNGMKRPENRTKVRLAMVKKLEQQFGQVYPFYNKSSCEYFNNLNIERGWNLQHAENGGEFYLKDLGYWLDAYDKERNIVVEYDERRHYHVDGSLVEKDIRRMNDIINHLKCSFYRYDVFNKRFYQVI